MRGDALQTFKNITSPNRENLGEILTVFRRKYVKPQSMATVKHKFQQLVFNPANQKLIDFLDELQKLAKDAFGVDAQANIEQFIYAKMPPHLKKSINQAHLENGTYEQTVTLLGRELELNSLEYPDETQMNTVTNNYQIAGNPDNAGDISSDTNDSNPIIHKNDRKSRTLYPPCETCSKMNYSTERCYVGANAANRPLPWKNKPQEQDAHDSITGCVQATAQHLNQKCHISTPEHWLTDRRPAKDYSTNPICCLAATSADICGYFKLANIQHDSTAETDESTHMPQLKQRKDVDSQTTS